MSFYQSRPPQARGDNFETITPENVIEFGKRPRSQDETPTQPCA